MMKLAMLLMAVVLGAAGDQLPYAVSPYHAGAVSHAAPEPVKDTYEVAAAKRVFHEQYQKLAREAELAPDTHQYVQEPHPTYTPSHYGQQYPHSQSSYTLHQAPEPVKDTYEVAAAKRVFHEQYQKLAREAELAPDTHQYVQEPHPTYTPSHYVPEYPHAQPSYTLHQAPEPVKDTYEVAAAKRAFHEQYQKLAREAELAPDTHQYVQEPHPTYTPSHYVPEYPHAQPSYTLHQAPEPVKDTYEVAAAKRAFHEQYQKLAREAELAPDTHQYVQEPHPTYTPSHYVQQYPQSSYALK